MKKAIVGMALAFLPSCQLLAPDAVEVEYGRGQGELTALGGITIDNDHGYGAVKLLWYTPQHWKRQERLRRGEYVYQTWPISWIRGGAKMVEEAKKGNLIGAADAAKNPNKMDTGEGGGDSPEIPMDRIDLWLYIAGGILTIAGTWYAKKKGALDKMPQLMEAVAKLATFRRKR